MTGCHLIKGDGGRGGREGRGRVDANKRGEREGEGGAGKFLCTAVFDAHLTHSQRGRGGLTLVASALELTTTFALLGEEREPKGCHGFLFVCFCYM